MALRHLIESVEPVSFADVLGIVRGDVLLSIDGQ